MGETVLEFDRVAVPAGHLHDVALWQASLRLERSQLALVHLEETHPRIPLADAAQGLLDPVEGSVSFLGRRWADRAPADAAAARARIGRVFEEPGWIGTLDMDENIMLAQLHHTHRGEAEIRDEASALARQFSLPGLPQGRPSGMHRADLRRAACVRAFLGRPELLLLERPTAGVYPAIMPALMSAVRAARARGAAVLWTTENWDVWNDPGIRPTLRLRMTGSQMSAEAAG